MCYKKILFLIMSIILSTINHKALAVEIEEVEEWENEAAAVKQASDETQNEARERQEQRAEEAKAQRAADENFRILVNPDDLERSTTASLMLKLQPTQSTPHLLYFCLWKALYKQDAVALELLYKFTRERLLNRDPKDNFFNALLPKRPQEPSTELFIRKAALLATAVLSALAVSYEIEAKYQKLATLALASITAVYGVYSEHKKWEKYRKKERRYSQRMYPQEELYKGYILTLNALAREHSGISNAYNLKSVRDPATFADQLALLARSPNFAKFGLCFFRLRGVVKKLIENLYSHADAPSVIELTKSLFDIIHDLDDPSNAEKFQCLIEKIIYNRVEVINEEIEDYFANCSIPPSYISGDDRKKLYEREIAILLDTNPTPFKVGKWLYLLDEKKHADFFKNLLVVDIEETMRKYGPTGAQTAAAPKKETTDQEEEYSPLSTAEEQQLKAEAQKRAAQVRRYRYQALQFEQQQEQWKAEPEAKTDAVD